MPILALAIVPVCAIVFIKPVKKDQFKGGSSLLWEISGNGLKSPSWLYGTIHFIGLQDLHFSDSTLSALKRSSALYLELSPEDRTNKEKIIAICKMPKGSSLKSMIANEDYKVLYRWFYDTMRLDITKLDGYKPIVLEGVIEKHYVKMFCDSVVSCEDEFIRLANSQELPVYGLETAEEQMNAFDNIPYSEQLYSSLKSIKNCAKALEVYKYILNAYKEQNISPMINPYEVGMFARKIKIHLLDNRNRRWLPSIREKAAKGSTFFAVGVSHLSGNTGIIALLRQQGYTVRPVF